MPRKAKAEVKKEPSDKAKLLVRIRDRYKVMTEADEENRRNAMDDLKFVAEPGHQWTQEMQKERGNRPCYEFNTLRIKSKRVINEIRANRPQGKVRAVEGGDKKLAELYEGLCRNIWNISDGDSIVDQQAEYAVDAGMCGWRLDTQYSSDTAFDQDILVKPIKNPFCLYADPAAQDFMKRDAEDWILTERISKKAFETKYGDADKTSFDDVQFDDEDEWEDDETVRVCEYWYKQPYTKEIWLVQTPQGSISIGSDTDEAQVLAKMPGYEQLIVRKRQVLCHKIMMCVASGDSILEGPVDWAGTMFPFVMVYGEYKVIDGRTVWHGLHRFAKDAQRSYNISRTSIDETIAGAPKEYFWATSDQAAGLTASWSEAHRKNFPFKLYNADPKAPGPPTRVGGAEVPVALLQQAQVAAQDLRDVTGVHEASVGEESPQQSGIALARKQNQQAIVTYNFPDNMAKGIKRTWELMIDLIPHIYDAEREMRVIGSDGAEDYIKINQVVVDPATQQAIRLNDVSQGKYDVVITVGPSFSTLRQEAAQVYGDLGAQNPAFMQIAGDLVFKSLDYPYAEEIAKRWQTILPPQIQEQINEGKEMPPEVQQAMGQVKQAMQQVEQHGQLVQAAAGEAKEEQAKADKAKSEVEKALSNLRAQQAEFETAVTKAEAGLTKQAADLALREAKAITGQGNQALANDREALATEVQKAVTAIQQLAVEFMNQAQATMAEIMTKQAPQVMMMPQPRPKRIRASRENGQLVGTVEYDEPILQ